MPAAVPFPQNSPTALSAFCLIRRISICMKIKWQSECRECDPNSQNATVAHVRDGKGDFVNLWRIHHSISQKDVL